jgi:hypothetical protein
MIYTIDSGVSMPVNFAPETLVEEVLQNISTLLGTVRGTVPLDRDFGVSADSVGRAFPAAQFVICTNVGAAIAEYEPRARVRDVQAEYDADGTVKITVEVSIHDEFENADIPRNQLR